MQLGRGDDRQDHVPRLLLRFHIPGRLDHVLELIAAIDDRAIFPSLDELLEEEDVLLRVARRALEHHLLVSEPRCPHRKEEIPEPIRRQVDAGRF